MDWDKLRIFHAVAESGSLTSAGKNLNLSQPVVSRHITTLEETLGVSLFRRHARGLVLTEQGEILHEATRDIFARLSLIKGHLIDTQRLHEGPLTITVSEFIAATWLAPRLPEFRERYPKIQLTILIDDRVLDLNRKEADAAIRLYKPKGPGLVQRNLTTIHFHICGSKDYFKKHGRPKNVKDLKQHFLLGFPETATSPPFVNPNWLFDVAGVDPEQDQNILMMNSMYAIFRAVREGGGLAALPDYLIRPDSNLEVVLPDLRRPDVDMYFIYAEERRNSQRITAFRNFILENIESTKF
jgi:DNA-binding transcriptional LysR family regulator